MSEPNTLIRAAGPGDAGAIHAMILDLARATNDRDKVQSEPGDFLRDGFGSKPLYEAVIAERDGEPVGLCLYFYSFSSWLGEAGIYVQDLYVAPELRGRGLGRRLLAAVAAKGKACRASHLRLCVSARNTAARSFYDRIGMQDREEERTYHLGGDAFAALAGERE